MSKKRYRPEEIVSKLREADILISQGKSVSQTIKSLGVSEVTYYRWRKGYIGMSVPQAKRLKELEKENLRLCKVERIWRREGLKVPKKQPKRRRLWLNDGSCIRLRPKHRNHVWAYDFVMDRTHCSSNLAVHGKTDTTSRSTGSSEMSCSTERYSIS